MRTDLQRQLATEATRLTEEKNTDRESAVPWATMRILEGHGSFDGCETEITVGYGRDRQMNESGAYPREWWDKFTPFEGVRFRVFYPDELDQPPELVDETMAQIGATPIGVFRNDEYDSYDHRGRDAAHYVLPDNSPIHYYVTRLQD